jgi:antitoxin CptB
MAPQNRAGEDILLRRRRLTYRAWHRGTRELDLLLGPFADAALDGMEAAELDRFERLLETQENELQTWLLGQETPPPTADRDLLDRIIAHKLLTTR